MEKQKRLYLSIAETAQVFGVSRQTVSTWVKSGKFQGARKFDRRWFIPKSAVIPKAPQAKSDQGEPCDPDRDFIARGWTQDQGDQGSGADKS